MRATIWRGVMGGFVAISLAACAAVPEGSGAELTDVATGEAKQFCGGIAGFACPSGMICVDDRTDSCDPANGGADCGGICKKEQKKHDKTACQDPNRVYVSTNPDECAVIHFYCESGEPFFDECGCGCATLTGDACGSSTCGKGEYCCNESCGICAPVGSVCTQQYCAPVCGPEDCGPALGMPNYLCEDGVTVAGPTGVCQSAGTGCSWEVIACP